MNVSETKSPPTHWFYLAPLLVVLWFLWPFSRLAFASIAYALIAGYALFLSAWGASEGLALVMPFMTKLVFRALAVLLAAFIIGFAASWGFSAATGGTADFEYAAEAFARAKDAIACAVVALAVAWRPSPKQPSAA